MKFYILIALCACSIDAMVENYIVEKWYNLTAPYKMECIEQSNANVEDADNMLLTLDVPNTPAFHEFIKCMYFKLGMLLEDGEFQVWKILEGADYLNYKFLRRCLKDVEHEQNISVRAYLLCDCIVKGLEIPCDFS